MENNSFLNRRIGWIVLAVVVVMVYVLRVVLVPFFLALVIAFLAMPLTDYLDRWLPRGWSALMAFLVFFIGGAGFLFWLGWTLGRELSALGEFLNQVIQRIDLEKIMPWLQQLARRAGDWQKLLTSALEYFGRGLQAAFSAIALLFGLFIVPVYSYYLLKDGKKMAADLQQMVPAQNRENIVGFFRQVNQILKNFVYGQLTIAGLEGAIAIAGFLILGIDYAVLLGTFIGLTSVIPFLGPPLGFAPAMLIAWLTTGQLWKVAGVAGIWILIELLENTVLQPKIMGNRMKMHPLVVILSIFIWGSLLGFLGVLLAAPITAIFHVIYLRLVQRHNQPAT